MTEVGHLHEQTDMNRENPEPILIDDVIEAPRVAGAPSVAEALPEHTSNFGDILSLIQRGVEESTVGGYAILKVRVNGRQKPLSQFMANDIYKFGLSTEEVNELLRAYVPEAEEIHRPTLVAEPTRRTLGWRATASIGEQRYFDPHELRSGLHKDFED